MATNGEIAISISRYFAQKVFDAGEFFFFRSATRMLPRTTPSRCILIMQNLRKRQKDGMLALSLHL